MRGILLRRVDTPFDLQPRQAWGYITCMILAPADPILDIYLLGCSLEGVFVLQNAAEGPVVDPEYSRRE